MEHISDEPSPAIALKVATPVETPVTTQLKSFLITEIAAASPPTTQVTFVVPLTAALMVLVSPIFKVVSASLKETVVIT